MGSAVGPGGLLATSQHVLGRLRVLGSSFTHDRLGSERMLSVSCLQQLVAGAYMEGGVLGRRPKTGWFHNIIDCMTRDTQSLERNSRCKTSHCRGYLCLPPASWVPGSQSLPWCPGTPPHSPPGAPHSGLHGCSGTLTTHMVWHRMVIHHAMVILCENTANDVVPGCGSREGCNAGWAVVSHHIQAGESSLRIHAWLALIKVRI